MGLHLLFGVPGPHCGKYRPDLLTWVLVFAVHSLRPSDIKFVAAIGDVQTVSISRRWRWETGFGIGDPPNELLVTGQGVPSRESSLLSKLEKSYNPGGSESFFFFFNQISASLYVQVRKRLKFLINKLNLLIN